MDADIRSQALPRKLFGDEAAVFSVRKPSTPRIIAAVVIAGQAYALNGTAAALGLPVIQLDGSTRSDLIALALGLPESARVKVTPPEAFLAEVVPK